MKQAPDQSAEVCFTKQRDGSFRLRQILAKIWFVLPIGVVIAVLLLVLEHARLSEAAEKFFASFVYTALIGIPASILLNWIGFHYSEKLRRYAVLVYAAVLVAVATIGCFIGALVLQLTGIVPSGQYWNEIQFSFPICIVITLVSGLAITAFETMRHKLQFATLELRTRQVEQERANKLLAEARLSSLESRIHPHFLFNTLNSIASLIPSDPKRAEETVSKLASLLRFSLNANHHSLVPLEQELKVVRDYLEIEATRFGRRLQFEVRVPEALANLKVPPLALQTLVENSVKHVVAQRSNGASIEVDGAQHNQHCELTVTDDGPGFSLAAISPDHGLGNLVGRLQLLYGEAAELNVKRVENKTVASISIPAGDSR